MYSDTPLQRKKLGTEILEAADELRKKAVNMQFRKYFQPQEYKYAKETYVAHWKAFKLLCKEINKLERKAKEEQAPQ